jgi:hypothetical protein
MKPKLKAYRVRGIYHGDPAEGDYITYVWARNEGEAGRACIAEMDENSEYCRGHNEVDLLSDYINGVREMLSSAETFLHSGPP